MNWVRKSLIAIFGVLLIGGIVSKSGESDLSVLREFGEQVFLWIAAAVILVHWQPAYRSLLLGAVVGFMSEIVGVATGIPFGRYHYTATLGVAVADVPLVMVAAWFVLLSYAWSIASALVQHRWLVRLLVAVLMTSFDLLIDPVAIGPMRLWEWEQSGPYYGIPLQNFLGWFIVSLLASLPIRAERTLSAAPHVVGVAVIAFFTAIAVREGLSLAAAVGVVLLALDGILARRRWLQYFALQNRITTVLQRFQ
jgi:putative membrane protein